jgi:hypothetical protein
MPAVTLSQLESHLWKAAWLLKGPVDAADFKTTTNKATFAALLSTPTLFVKIISPSSPTRRASIPFSFFKVFPCPSPKKEQRNFTRTYVHLPCANKVKRPK